MTKTSATVYTYTYTVPTGDGTSTITLSNGTDEAGNTITSSPTSGATFTVDNTAPSISAIETSAFSWGSILSTAEQGSDQTVTVTTAGEVVGQDVTITLNARTHTGTVQANNTATVTITAATLSSLNTGTSYTLLADVSDAAGNPAPQVTSSTFYTNPKIETINRTHFSWGAVLSSTEDNVDGYVTVNTSNIDDGKTITVALNGENYTGTVSSDQAVVTITGSGLDALVNGQTYTVTASCSDGDADGNASNTVTSSENFLVDESLGAGAGGDPYVITLDNKLYKMPNFQGYARMLEGEYENKKFIINVSSKISSQQSANDSDNFVTNFGKTFGEHADEIINGNFENKNEAFFDKIYIQWGSEYILYDLDEMKLLENNSKFEISGKFRNKGNSFVDLSSFEHYKEVRGTKGEISTKIKIGNVSIIASNINNPQFRTAFRVNNSNLINNRRGALVNKLYLKDIKLKKITDTNKIKRTIDRVPRRVQKEIYFQKDSKIRIEKDIELF